LNREEILRRCVATGVAPEADITAVTRLFYVQLLSALQRGQSVELPSFGTFGTRVAGVKRKRKIPYFDPSPEFAREANQRFQGLKTVVIGSYEPVLELAEADASVVKPPSEGLPAESAGGTILDTSSDVTREEFDTIAAELQRPQQLQEVRIMPRLNLRDESADDDSLQDSEQMNTPPSLRDVGGGGGGGLSPMVLIALIIAVLALGVFALNHFGVIHLWGKKPMQVAEPFPEPILPPGPAVSEEANPTAPPPSGTQAQAPAPTSAVTEQTPAITPPSGTKAPAVKPPLALSGSGGDYTIQVSSWASRAKADAEAQRLTTAGYSAFVEEGLVGGTTWYRVRVGRYASEREAKEAMTKMQPDIQADLWVARAGR
jgi:cell division septation protein DedD